MKFIFIFLLIINSAFAQNYDTPHHFPFQDVNKDYHGRWQFVNTGSKLIVFYYDVSSSSGVIASRTSTDSGVTWSGQNNIVGQLEPNGINFSACISSAGRLILVYSRISTSYILYSDDSGLIWSAPSQVSFCTYPDLNTTPDNKIILSGYSSNSFSISTDNGTSWQRKSLPSRAYSLDIINQNEYLLHTITSGNIYNRKSTDAGTTWSAQSLIIDETNDIDYLSSAVNNEGHSIICYTIPNIYQPDIVSVKSTDAGQSWSSPTFLTTYKGYDGFPELYMLNNELYMSLLSDRVYTTFQQWSIKVGFTTDSNSPPGFSSSYSVENSRLFLRVTIQSDNPVLNTKFHYTRDDVLFDSSDMFNDGLHGDGLANDNTWGGDIAITRGDYTAWYFSCEGISGTYFIGKGSFLNYFTSDIGFLTAGSLSNWYSISGSEVEEGGPIKSMQYGLQYPSEYPYQDVQVSKAMWLGVTNFKDEFGYSWPYKLARIGPRITPHDFFPVKFITKARFEKPQVFINGNLDYKYNPYIPNPEVIDPVMKADMEIYNELNSTLGITIKRKIFQFSHEKHDNYIVHDYTFINTGNIDSDPAVEIPSNNITGLQIFNLFRWAVNKQSRYVIGNNSGWGINTMIDTRGDGLITDPPGENYRTIFGWHGYYNDGKVVSYDNIGGPVWDINSISRTYFSPEDTIGRLAAVQFPGVLTLHADNSPHNSSDNFQQPKTTIYINSDDPAFYSYSSIDTSKMSKDYQLITRGHDPRHAWQVEPSGNFGSQKNDPNLYTTGGFSAGNGYGPYNLAFGDSIRIVWIEGVAGISIEKAIETGRHFKQGLISAYDKNVIVLTGKDSLMKTWKHATDNFLSGFNLPKAPLPPMKFFVNPKSDRIEFNWEPFENSNAVKYRLYRRMNLVDSLFIMIYECPSDSSTFIDYNLVPGKEYIYYLSSVDASGLESNKTFTMLNTGVKILSDLNNEDITPEEFALYQNYPNPFNSQTIIKFLVPELSFTTLKIYDILGNEVAVLLRNEVDPGKHEISFNANKLSSGVYVYQLKSGIHSDSKKLVLIK